MLRPRALVRARAPARVPPFPLLPRRRAWAAARASQRRAQRGGRARFSSATMRRKSALRSATLVWWAARWQLTSASGRPSTSRKQQSAPLFVSTFPIPHATSATWGAAVRRGASSRRTSTESCSPPIACSATGTNLFPNLRICRRRHSRDREPSSRRGLMFSVSWAPSSTRSQPRRPFRKSMSGGAGDASPRFQVTTPTESSQSSTSSSMSN
mmetsp:Transcript_36425/g.66098  ORF Transcript_36425/g.66098 Transcript_36425/m.66098 type:complete len:212 (-) Transcript_36425:140-775(-)